MKNKKGFTLIELLVVIAIIAMLLAILMPALGIVKAKARQLTCSAHMHNIGLVVLLYGNDHDSKLPTASNPATDFGRWLFDLPWNIAEPIRVGYQLETIYCPANSLRTKKGDDLGVHYLSHMKNNGGLPSRPEDIDAGWAVSDYFWLMDYGRTADNWRTVTDWRYPEGTKMAGKKIFLDKLTVKQPSAYPLVTDVVFTSSAEEPYDFSQVIGMNNMQFKSNHLSGTKATGGNTLRCDGSVIWKNKKSNNNNLELNYVDYTVKHFW